MLDKNIINAMISDFRTADKWNKKVEADKELLRADANGEPMKYIGTSGAFDVKRPGKTRKVLNTAVASKDMELVNRLIAAGYITVDWKRWEKENPKEYEETLSRPGFSTEKAPTAAAVSLTDLLHNN